MNETIELYIISNDGVDGNSYAQWEGGMRSIWVMSSALALLSCEAFVLNKTIQSTTSGPTGSQSTYGTGPGQFSTFECSASLDAAPVALPMLRISKSQYTALVNSAFGGKVSPSSIFPDVAKSRSLTLTTQIQTADFDSQTTDVILSAAEEVAVSVAAQAGALLPCAQDGSSVDACAAQFVDKFGPKLFRKVLSSVERAEILAAHQDAKTDGAPIAVSFAYMTAALLQAPQFLFQATQWSNQKVDADTLAHRISLLLADQPASDAFVQSVRTHVSTNAVALRTSVQQVVVAGTNPQASSRFFKDWLGVAQVTKLSRDANFFPSFSDAQGAALFTSFERLGAAALSEKWTFPQLFQSRKVFSNSAVAPLYGGAGSNSTDFAVAELPASIPAVGIMGNAAVMAAHAFNDAPNFIGRGHMYFADVLCGELGAPPANAASFLPKSPAGSLPPSTRERAAAIEAMPSCAGCHTQFNPYGLVFDNFSPIGSYVTQDAYGRSVNAAVTLKLPQDTQATSFSGPGPLLAALSTKESVRTCMTVQLFRYFAGRTESANDRCVLKAMDDALKNESISSAISALLADPAITRDPRLP